MISVHNMTVMASARKPVILDITRFQLAGYPRACCLLVLGAESAHLWSSCAGASRISLEYRLSSGRAWTSHPGRKSTYSGSNGGNCVEVADNLPGIVAVRDSKDPDGPSAPMSGKRSPLGPVRRVRPVLTRWTDQKPRSAAPASRV
jgi:Domain of unknown function (DUF397)